MHHHPKPHTVCSAAALLTCLLLSPPAFAETGAHVYSHEHREVRTTTQSSSREVTRETTRSSGTHTSTTVRKDRLGPTLGTILFPRLGSSGTKGRSSVLEKITDTIPLESREKGILAAFQGDNGKWGLLDLKGQEAVPPQYKSIGLGNNGTFAVTGKKAVTAITADGQPLAADSPELQQTKPPGLYSFKKDGKYGFQDETGKTVLAPIYKDVIAGFQTGIAFVKMPDGKKAAINSQGQLLYLLPYDRVFPFQNGLAEYQRDVSGFNWASVLGIVGAVHFGLGYDPQTNGPLTRDGVKRGYIDRSGQIVIDSHNDFVYPMTPFGTFVEDKGQTIFVDRTGKLLYGPGKFHIAEDTACQTEALANGQLSLVDEKSKKMGVLDLRSGQLIIPYTFEEAYFLGSDRYLIRDGQSTLLVSGTDGKVLASYPKKAKLLPYGTSQVTWLIQDKQYSLVDANGQVVYTAPKDSITTAGTFLKSFSLAKSGGRYGIIDTAGKWLVPPQYKNLTWVW